MVRLFEPDTDYPIDIGLLPKHWLVTTVGAVISDVRNGFGTSRHNSVGNGIPHLRPMNVTRDGRIALNEVKFTEEDPGLRVSRGEILFNNTNSAELVGKSALFDQDGDWAFSNHMTRLRVPSSISAEFIAFQFLYLWRQGYFRQRSTQHVSQASINNRTLTETVPLVVAPAEEQARIAKELRRQFARFESVSRAVDSARVRLREYEKLVLIGAASGCLVPTEAELARSTSRPAEDGNALLQSLISASSLQQQPQTSPSLSQTAAFGIIGRADESQTTDLPMGWARARVDQVGVVTLGRQRAPQHHTGEHMRPYLRVANVLEDRIDTSDVRQMNFTPAEFKTYQLEYGDILLNEGQSPELVGRPAMYRDEVPGACFQKTLIRFRSYPGVSPGFALIIFRAYLHNGRFRSISKWTTNIAHLTLGRFLELEFPLPPLVEQERIVAEVTRRLDIAHTLTFQLGLILQRVDAARDLALSQAFTGVLVTSQQGDGDVLKLVDGLAATKTVASSGLNPKEAPMPRQLEGRKGPRTPLREVLTAAESPLTPEQLLASSGIGEDLIEEFFAELKREHLAGRISQTHDGQGVVHLVASELGV